MFKFTNRKHKYNKELEGLEPVLLEALQENLGIFLRYQCP